MPVKTSEELVDSHETEMPKKTRQKKRFRSHQPNHRHRLDVVAPHHRVRPRSPGKTLPADGKLKVVQVYSDVGIEQLQLIRRSNRARQYLRQRLEIGVGNDIANRVRICWGRGRVLILGADIDDQRTCRSVEGSAGLAIGS